MSKNEEFYIGYLPKAPKNISKWLRLIIPTLIITLVGIAYVVARFQPKSVASTFEFGVYKEFEGRIVQEPFPMMYVELGKGKKKTAKLFLLGVFGKMGAGDLIGRLARSLDQPLENYRFKVKGSLIYYAGKTMLELDHDLESILSAEIENEPYRITPEQFGHHTFNGEILDTKCFLGVMKPGRGKPHRSCAVRCIAGVPVAVSVQMENDETYALLVDEKGNALNSSILSAVGRQIQYSGKLEKWEDWYVVKLEDYNMITRQLNKEFSVPTTEKYLATLCR